MPEFADKVRVELITQLTRQKPGSWQQLENAAKLICDNGIDDVDEAQSVAAGFLFGASSPVVVSDEIKQAAFEIAHGSELRRQANRIRLAARAAALDGRKDKFTIEGDFESRSVHIGQKADRIFPVGEVLESFVRAARELATTILLRHEVGEMPAAEPLAQMERRMEIEVDKQTRARETIGIAALNFRKPGERRQQRGSVPLFQATAVAAMKIAIEEVPDMPETTYAFLMENLGLRAKDLRR
jgi:hypothetical protein